MEIANHIIDKKYKLIKKLGSGGFGNVWLAKDILLEDRFVAIKSLRRNHLVGDNPLIEEMQFLNSLDHPNIIKFYHHIIIGANLYIVMEYCKEGSLDKIRDNGPQDVDKIFNWASIIADTLQSVHDKSIIHHDIKPENILLSENNEIKIADFGIANQNNGTIYYLAPEQLLNEVTDEIDPRMDIYALGITILELITGNNPFYGLKRHEMVNKKINHDFIPNNLERWVQDILLKSTHPTPEQRFQTMKELKEAIISKTVQYNFDINNIKSQMISESAKYKIKNKKWKSAEKACDLALKISPNCIQSIITAGQIQLMLQNTQKANNFFDHALKINPRANVQKELGWISLQYGHISKAISMLNDYLQRNSTDYEAYNLLLECFYKNNRYRAGKYSSDQILSLTKKYSCFQNNNFLFSFFNNDISREEILKLDKNKNLNEFMKYNIEIITESEKSYDINNIDMLKNKLLFQDFRFNESIKSSNRVTIKNNKNKIQYIDHKFISIGRNDNNSIIIKGDSVSRRHDLLLNCKNDVWIYDLGSKFGTFVDGEKVEGKKFLHGIHLLNISGKEYIISTDDQLLI